MLLPFLFSFPLVSFLFLFLVIIFIINKLLTACCHNALIYRNVRPLLCFSRLAMLLLLLQKFFNGQIPCSGSLTWPQNHTMSIGQTFVYHTDSFGYAELQLLLLLLFSCFCSSFPSLLSKA